MNESRLRSPRVLLNGGGGSVAQQLDEWLELTAGGPSGQVTFVTSFLTFRGLMLLTRRIRALVDAGNYVRILLGVAPEELVQIYRLARIDTPDPELEEIDVLTTRVDDALRAELNRIPLGKNQLLRLQDLARLLGGPQIQSRRYRRGYLHAKATLVEHDQRVQGIVGSSNFTFGGMAGNRELNSVVDVRDARLMLKAISEWWQQAEPYDLAQLVWDRFLAYPPALVFLRMMHEAYGNEVDAPPSKLELADFQRDGVAKVSAILHRYRGALIADAVGLGKTFIAGEVARLAIQSGDGPVKIVVPASLIGAWNERLTHWGLRCELISYEKLIKQYDAVQDEGHTWPPCGLLIVDEAHALRNPRTDRMAAVRSLLAANPNSQIVLMTATPVNNHEGDLMELLLLADRSLEPRWEPERTHTRQNARTAEGQRLWTILRALASKSATAREQTWFYDILDRRILRRDRDFIKIAYPHTDLPFPKLEPEPVTYCLSDQSRRLLVDVLDAVGYTDLPPELARDLVELRGDTAPLLPLTFAVYRRPMYGLGAIPPSPNPLMVELIRLMLCKRIESSPAALASTVVYMKEKTRRALAELQQGVVRIPRMPGRPRRRKDATGWDLGSSDTETNQLLEEGKPEDYTEFPAGLFDTATMRADLTRDLRILERLARQARQAIPDDPKRVAVAELILQALKDPRGPKIVIFASARATTHDFGAWLHELVERDDRFTKLRGRIVNTGTLSPPKDADRVSALARFAPKTARIPSRNGTIPPCSDDYDVLICTDMLAEGVNLQQAAFCVNYDLTWNPQRLGQRVGRLDRIKSEHSRVTCWTVLPDAGIDLVLNIMDMITDKAHIAKDTVGVPTPLFPGSPCRSYTSTLKDIRQPHRVRAQVDDPQRDHGWIYAWLGNARRADLAWKAVQGLPFGAGAVHPHTFRDPGVVYCFRILTASGRHKDTAFAHVHAGNRWGATVLKTNECLRQARLDPMAWIRSVQAQGKAPTHKTYPPMRDADLALVGNLLDHARSAIAEAHGIPKSLATEQLQLITWIVLPSGKAERP